ncbi:MAG: hypothetical protein EA389_13080 [Ilumatobacter sp.]|nr:MAG: hypothetical protein EA389_13080 [Ilumatobacter sp.]
MTNSRGVFAAVVFIMIGVGFLLDELGVIELRLAYVLPLLLIFAGVWILFGTARRGGRDR